MKAALLDVNVLIALLDPAHEFHDAAHHWFERNRKHYWATCPITENACLRILASPSYPYMGLRVSEIRDLLGELCADAGHQFWPDSLSVLDIGRFDLSAAVPKIVTDIYLLGISHANGGRLVTFDQGIRWQSVVGAEADSLEVIHGALE